MSQAHLNPSLPQALSRLDQLTNWERKPRGEMRVGLEPMFDLMQRLGNPHRSFRAIHVAGTKGKGSVSALIEAGLLRAGWRVGRYASPHVDRVNERVSILGQEVEDDALATAIMQVLDSYESAKQAATAAEDATRFDVITAAAFVVFRDAGLDWVVVEVGLGGRLDSTNVVFGEVAIVTNIGLEHTEILGVTREAIAGEKVGILKPGATLATTLAIDDAAGKVLQQRADELGCQILRTDLPEDATIAATNIALVGLVFDYLGRQGVQTAGKRGSRSARGCSNRPLSTRRGCRGGWSASTFPYHPRCEAGGRACPSSWMARMCRSISKQSCAISRARPASAAIASPSSHLHPTRMLPAS